MGLTTLYVLEELIETSKILTEKKNNEKEQFFELSNMGIAFGVVKPVVSRPVSFS